MVALSVAQSLAYLGVAALWALRNELGLRTLLARVLPPGPQGDFLGGRGVCPGGAALPGAGLEALGRALGADHGAAGTPGRGTRALNNAHIHRVLEALDEASERLQEELAPLL